MPSSQSADLADIYHSIKDKFFIYIFSSALFDFFSDMRYNTFKKE